MKKVIICRGLPASGKSSWAKDFVFKNPNQYKRINMDDLRAMFDNSYQSNGNEKFMKKMRDILIIETLKDGKSVISDNTHLSPKSVNHIKQLVEKFNKDNNDNVQVEIKFFDASVEECIKRDLKRQNSVGEKVIREMYDMFIAPKIEPIIQDINLPKAILVDIDGTVADKGERSPYDWASVGGDTPKTNVINIVNHLSEKYKIIFFSGRDEVCRDQTIEWLSNNLKCGEFELYMRQQNDNRKDSIVKKEMFDKYIRDKYFIESVIDDRQQVVDMYRKEIGLTVMQVDYGNF